MPTPAEQFMDLLNAHFAAADETNVDLREKVQDLEAQVRTLKAQIESERYRASDVALIRNLRSWHQALGEGAIEANRFDTDISRAGRRARSAAQIMSAIDIVCDYINQGYRA